MWCASLQVDAAVVLEILGDLGVFGEEVERPCERIGGGFVSSDHHGKQFIADQREGHGGVGFFVACFEQQADEIAAWFVGFAQDLFAALVDDR